MYQCRATFPARSLSLMGCAVLTGGGAVINAGSPREGQDVLVVGLGGVGMAAILVAVALGRGRVIGVDTLEPKLALATKLGGTPFTPRPRRWRPASALRS